MTFSLQQKPVIAAAVIAVATVSFASSASATNYAQSRMYEVTVTNITKAVQFTPILAASHKNSVGFFTAGDAPSEALAQLAEGGNTQPLQDILDGLSGKVAATTTVDGLLSGGESRTFEISSDRRTRYLSLAAMLLPTNDSFVALNTVALPVWGSVTYFARGYDAGSEINDELCSSIPGPACGGPEGGEFNGIDPNAEGFVHISSGIHGIGDIGAVSSLSPAEGAARYDWRDAVAKVTIKRIR